MSVSRMGEHGSPPDRELHEPGEAVTTRGSAGADPRVVAEPAGLALPTMSATDLLGLIVELAVQVVEGVDGASVSVFQRAGPGFHTSNASSPTIRSIDEAQYEKAEGPCVEAIRTAGEVTVSLPIGRWPAFARRAAEEGIASVSSLPLIAAEQTVGALNLYSTSERELGGDALMAGRALAAQAALVLTNAAALTLAELTNQQLREALQTRDMIGQAKGILMARQRIDPDGAFDILRRASQRTNRKLRDVAADIVNSFGDTGAPG